MNSHFQFQYPWVLGLLALLPVYAFLCGRVGRMAALRFSSADLARAAGNAARAASGRLLLFSRLLTVALCLVALAGPRFAHDRTETQASGVDIMLVLDISWSMNALDMGKAKERVSRIDIAQAVMEDFIRRRPSDRVVRSRVAVGARCRRDSRQPAAQCPGLRVGDRQSAGTAAGGIEDERAASYRAP